METSGRLQTPLNVSIRELQCRGRRVSVIRKKGRGPEGDINACGLAWPFQNPRWSAAMTTTKLFLSDSRKTSLSLSLWAFQILSCQTRSPIFYGSSEQVGGAMNAFPSPAFKAPLRPKFSRLHDHQRKRGSPSFFRSWMSRMQESGRKKRRRPVPRFGQHVTIDPIIHDSCRCKVNHSRLVPLLATL